MAYRRLIYEHSKGKAPLFLGKCELLFSMSDSDGDFCDLLLISQRGGKCGACPAPGRRRRDGYLSLPPGLKSQCCDGRDSGSRFLVDEHSKHAHTSRDGSKL